MAPLIFLASAVLIALGVVALVVRRALHRYPLPALPDGELLPSTPLQRLARGVLLVSVLLTLPAVGLVVYSGAERAWEDTAVRLGVLGCLVAALAVFGLYLLRVTRWIASDDGTLDERDRFILGTAPTAQAPVLLVTLVVWSIALSESFHESRVVPLVFVSLIFWSCLMMSQLSLLAGVVLGYQRR